MTRGIPVFLFFLTCSGCSTMLSSIPKPIKFAAPEVDSRPIDQSIASLEQSADSASIRIEKIKALINSLKF